MTGARAQLPTTAPVTPPGILLPAYFHPALGGWERLTGARLGRGAAVLNVADGPGERADPVFAAAVSAARAAGVPFAGYCDLAYGGRPAADVLREVARYRAWYGVTGVFLDRVPATGSAGRLRRLEGRLRRAGADRLILNPGTVPDRRTLAVGDVVVTFEGPWARYREERPVVPMPAARQCHLVYATPPGETPEALRLARERGADLVYVTDGAGSNPWDAVAAWVPGA